MRRTRAFHLSAPNQGEDGVLLVRDGRGFVVEFRGVPYSELTPNSDNEFTMMLDALDGMHATVLFQDEEVAVIEGMHEDFANVQRLFEQALEV